MTQLIYYVCCGLQAALECNAIRVNIAVASKRKGYFLKYMAVILKQNGVTEVTTETYITYKTNRNNNSIENIAERSNIFQIS